MSLSWCEWIVYLCRTFGCSSQNMTDELSAAQWNRASSPTPTSSSFGSTLNAMESKQSLIMNLTMTSQPKHKKVTSYSPCSISLIAFCLRLNCSCIIIRSPLSCFLFLLTLHHQMHHWLTLGNNPPPFSSPSLCYVVVDAAVVGCGWGVLDGGVEIGCAYVSACCLFAHIPDRQRPILSRPNSIKHNKNPVWYKYKNSFVLIIMIISCLQRISSYRVLHINSQKLNRLGEHY